MVQKLSSYIIELKRAGYSSQAISAHLMRAGYSQAEISSAFLENKEHLPKLYLFFVFLLSIFVFGLAIYFIFFYSSIELTVNAKLLSSYTVLPGDTIVFERSIVSSAKKVPVSILYELVSSSGQIVFQKTEKLLISGTSKTQSKISVPLLLDSGRYGVKLTVTFADGSAKSEFFVDVLASQKETTSATDLSNKIQNPVDAVQINCKEPCVDANPCIKGECVSGFCKFEPIIPCCGNSKCEAGEDSSCGVDCETNRASKDSVISSAQSVAKSDISKAVLLCNSLIEDVFVDNCILTILANSNTAAICNSIRSINSRDDCYMRFALKNDFFGCDRITDRYMANSCVYLSQAQNS